MRLLSWAVGFAAAFATSAIATPLETRQSSYTAYMFAYFTGEGYSNGETISFAVSNGNNALNWTEVHGGNPYLTSTVGTKGVRDPSIIRAHDGSKFWLLATDLKMYGNGNWDAAVRTGSRSIVIWESTDLKNWGTPRLVQVSPATAGNTWAPEAVWDPSQNKYMVFWASSLYATSDTNHTGTSYHRILRSTTTDFKSFSAAEVWIDYGYPVIDTTLAFDSSSSTYYRFSKDERANSASAPNGKFPFEEKGSSLSGTWSTVAVGIGKGSISRGEGPTVFKSNTVANKWHMFIDEFGGKPWLRAIRDYKYCFRRMDALIKLLLAKPSPSRFSNPDFTGEGYSNGETISFAVSNGNNALNWTEVHGGTPYLTSTVGTTGVRDPSLIRAHDGSKFWLLGTDLKIYGNGNWTDAVTHGSRSLVIWESTNLKDWGTPRLVQVSPATAGNTWAPEAIWDPAQKAYMVFWASQIFAANDTQHTGSSYQRILRSTTTDFKSFSPAETYIDYGRTVIDTTTILDTTTQTYYRFNKDVRNLAGNTADSNFVTQEKSSSVLGTWTEVRAGIGKGIMTRGEGPTVFKSNTVANKWHLFIDEFGGRGYVPLESTDIASGVWTASTNYTLPARPRHGSVIPITEAERQVLLSL
ncbi:hypothetical protein FRC06_001881 [Ceratobasidium sp. 370]|nr:hypothetical protein FRC06_001881 [Ceratobasidium sp. 370]